jgi:hypothetical protein
VTQSARFPGVFVAVGLAALLALSASAYAAKGGKVVTPGGGANSQYNASKRTEEITAQTLAQLDQCFKDCDLNKNKIVTLYELKEHFGIGQVYETIKKACSDKDGNITEDKFKEWAQEYAPKYAEGYVKAEQELMARIAAAKDAAEKSKLQNQLSGMGKNQFGKGGGGGMKMGNGQYGFTR